MAQDISIDHGQFMQATGHMRDNVVPVLQRTATNLEASVQAAGAGWKGEAKRSFDKFAANLHGAIQELHQSLGDVTTALAEGNKHLGTNDVNNSDLFGQAGNGLESAPLTNLV